MRCPSVVGGKVSGINRVTPWANEVQLDHFSRV